MSALLKSVIFLALAVAAGLYVWSAQPEILQSLSHELLARVPIDPSAVEALSEELDYWVARQNGSLERWQAFLAAHEDGSHARLAKAEVERLLRTERATALSAAEFSKDATADASARSEVANKALQRAPEGPSSDEVCARDADRLERLIDNPSPEEAHRFKSELRCEALRPALLILMRSLASAASAPVAAEAPTGAALESPGSETEVPPLQGKEVASHAPEEACKHDADRLVRLRGSYSIEEATRFIEELRCDALLPQLLAVIESLSSTAPAPVAAEVPTGAAPEDPGSDTEVPPLQGTDVASRAPEEVCEHDADRLKRLIDNPSSDEAQRFANVLKCERLRPQLERLLENFAYAPPAPVVVEISQDAAPEAKAASEPARPTPAPPSTEVASLSSDESCKRDAVRLAQLRDSRSSQDAQRLADGLKCEKLRPQLERLMESEVYAPPVSGMPPGSSPNGSPAQGPKAAKDCIAERDALDRLRAEPSAEKAQQFWRDLRCERLRPQLRLLLESLNVAGDPSGGCRREAEELNRIRANPSRSEVERFVRDLTCDALKPQSARLLESLAQ
jgi:hypothetical protein